METASVDSGMYLHGWTLNTEFFSETLHCMRTEGQYASMVNDIVAMPRMDTRHQKAVLRMATAYVKLLFPHITRAEDMDVADFDRYCLQPAVRRRDIIRRQCAVNDIGTKYREPIPKVECRML